MPIGKKEPETGLQTVVGVGIPPAVTANVTSAPHWLGSLLLTMLPGQVMVGACEIEIGVETVCASTVVEALPAAATVAVKTELAFPVVVVVFVGKTVPLTPAKLTGVPLGILPEPDVSRLAEFKVRSAVRLDMPPSPMVLGAAVIFNASQGSASMLALPVPPSPFAVPAQPVPVAPGP